MTDPMQGQQGQGQAPGPGPLMGDQGQLQGPPPDAQEQQAPQPQQPPSQDPAAMEQPAPPQPSQDPVQTAIQAILSMPAAEAIRRVYAVAASAAKARERSRLLVARMDAFGYHALLSSAPELKYASELMAARRELDALAQERRRLGLEAVKARQSTTPASVARASTYEMQAAGASDAMEHVAAGVLMFLSMPSLPKPQSQDQQPPQPQQQLQQSVPAQPIDDPTSQQQPTPKGGPS